MFYKIFNIISFVPIVGLILLYCYIVFSIVVIGNTSIYQHDPKSLGLDYFYNFTLYFFAIGLLVLFFNISALLVVSIIRKLDCLNKKSIAILLVGLVLELILYFSDPGSYRNWFFD